MHGVTMKEKMGGMFMKEKKVMSTIQQPQNIPEGVFFRPGA